MEDRWEDVFAAVTKNNLEDIVFYIEVRFPEGLALCQVIVDHLELRFDPSLYGKALDKMVDVLEKDRARRKNTL